MISAATQQVGKPITALSNMREGILLVLIAWILLSIGLLALIASLWLAIITTRHIEIAGVAPRVSLLVAAVLAIVGAVVGLVGFYFKFIPGVTELARADSRFDTARTLIKIGYVWGLILVVIGIPLLLVIIGILVLVVGYILLLLGYIGVIILSFKLNDVYPNALYLAAAILFIISMIVPVVGVVSWILLYVALGDTINKLRA
ncbi:MAG: DUF973 family protein [Sulfolobales archaeon]|nr:DUF973 family protein [Sulfolobales archaeon]MDW8082528.1 DUF973 family protein [Sulfolobales archaeon]